jgi:hypothetical protein
VLRDACDRSLGTIPQPETEADVEAWLAANTDDSVADPEHLQVDGRDVLRYELSGRDCPPPTSDGFASPPDEVRPAGITYLIPTPRDAILFLVSTDGGSTPPDAQVADEIVRSMTFDE